MLDVDATVVVTYSEKEDAAATFEWTFGYHPIGVYATTPASSSPGTRARERGVEHDRRPRPVPHRYHRAGPGDTSHGLWTGSPPRAPLRGRRVENSMTFAVTKKVCDVIVLVPKEA